MASGEPTSREPGTDPGLDLLKHQLAVAEETLRAIRAGEVDAILVDTADSHQLTYILETPDLPYRRLVEGMSEGAALIDTTGLVTYANQSLAALLGVSLEHLLGKPFADWLDEPDRNSFNQRLAAASSTWRGELTLRRSDSDLAPVLLGITVPEASEGSLRYLTVTDLSEQSARQEEVRQLNKELTAGLEELRKEQGKEQDRLVELEQFQRLTIGRELKMIELKKEIEHLRRSGRGQDDE
ncbi:MAG TPA: PAS domain-containing protein [Dermatophilaceae bacterium]|jgi:PAS domain S-box-containing protein